MGLLREYGIAIRAGSPAVLITVPETWRHRAGIGWGNNLGVVSSLRLLSCPRQLGAWNVYAGGFYLRSPSGCVPLVFHIGRQTATLTFAIGNDNCGSATRCAAPPPRIGWRPGAVKPPGIRL